MGEGMGALMIENAIVETDELREYMKSLEEKILIPGIFKGVFEVEIKIPTKPQKLLFSEFGEFVQPYVDDERIFVIDYYGFLKKSLGFIQTVGALAENGFDIKSIKTPIAYFSGVKIEHLSANAPELLILFSTFKAHLVRLRKFPARWKGKR